jgi:glycosyltransferase involved in cell wall biosynthesis
MRRNSRGAVGPGGPANEAIADPIAEHGPGPVGRVVGGVVDGTPPEVDVTVVIPYYNPGPRLRDTVIETVRTLHASGVTFEVITVSDGSTDGSAATVADLEPEVVHHLVLARTGKGGAVRAGLEQGRGRYLGFIDGDGDIPPDLLGEFVAIVDARRPDIVVGSKQHPESDVVYPPGRRLSSWGYRTVVHALFRLDVGDTQAGIKLVRRDVLAAVLPVLHERGFAFDLELLVAAREAGYRDVVEAPMRVRERLSSTIAASAVMAMVRDTLAIWWRQRVRHTYDAPQRVAATVADPARP